MRWFSLFLLTVSLAVFATGCSKSDSPAPTTDGANTTTPVEDGHDHEGHDHEGGVEVEEGVEAPPSDEFGAPPAESETSEPEISLDPAVEDSQE